MTHKAIILKFVVLTMLATALGILISIGATPVPTDQHSVSSSGGFAELQKPDGRYSRLHLLVSKGY